MNTVLAESGQGRGRGVFRGRAHGFRITAEIALALRDAEGGSPSGQPAGRRRYPVILAESKDPYPLKLMP